MKGEMYQRFEFELQDEQRKKEQLFLLVINLPS